MAKFKMSTAVDFEFEVDENDFYGEITAEKLKAYVKRNIDFYDVLEHMVFEEIKESKLNNQQK